MSKRILTLLLVASLAILPFCTKKSTSPEEKLLPPTDLTITLVENNQVQINWMDNSTDETAYLIDRKKGSFNWLENFGDVGASITSFTDNIPTNSDTVYSYRIRAFDGDDYSAYSDTIAWFSDNAAPSDLHIEQIAQDTLQLTWQDNSVGEQYFRIDRKIDEKGWQIDYAHVPSDTTYFLDYTTALYDTCNYRVCAVRGISCSDSTKNSFVPFLSTPSDLHIEPLTATEVKLTFRDNCHNEEGYRLYTKRGETAEWDSVDFQEYISPMVIITDKNVIPGIINYFKICAYYENETSASIEGNINTLPAPSNFTCRQQNVHALELNWQDNSQLEQGFGIDRSIGEGEWQNEYVILDENTTEWTDENVDLVQNYYNYRIYSFYEDNLSLKIETGSRNTFIKTFGGNGCDEGNSVLQADDGGFIITGKTDPNGARDSNVWLIKTDEWGNEEWNKTFGESDYGCGYSVLQTNDGGFIITGGTASYASSYGNVLLIKTDEWGNEEWYKAFGGSDFDCGYSVSKTNDGGFIVLFHTMQIIMEMYGL